MVSGPTVTAASQPAAKPYLTGPAVSPESGDEGVAYAFSVRYTSAADLAPESANLAVIRPDGSKLWVPVRSADQTYADGSVYAGEAVLAALAYCLLAGWGVPAQRTFFMLLTVAAAAWLRQATRPLATLALAAFVVCLLDPWAVIAPGFWLSFGAVAAIMFTVIGRPGAGEPGWQGRLGEAGRVQAAVTLALLPLTAALFRQVSVVSIAANAVAIPLVSLAVTPLALLAGLLVSLPEPLSWLATPCLAVAHSLLQWLHALLGILAAPTWASVSLPAPPGWAVALALAGVAWLLAPPGWPLRWAGAIWLMPLLLWPAARPQSGELWVTALDVGQGSAVLDLCLLEAPKDHPVIVEPGALVSHQACLHGAVVRTGALVGIRAIVLDGAEVGEGALVGAGAVVPPRMRVPAGVLVLGMPAKVVRELNPAERKLVAQQLSDLTAKAAIYRCG